MSQDGMAMPLNGKKDPYDIDFTSTTAKVPWYDKIIQYVRGIQL